MSANKELATVFEQIADLLEIQGADPFRVNSYRRAARTVKDLSEDIALIARQGRLQDIPGIGKGTAEKIQQYLATGKIELHQELLAQVPEGLPRLLEIPGLGPKKVALAWKRLGVTGLDELKRAIASGTLAELPGMGAQSVKKIAEGIAFLERSRGRTPLGVAWPIAAEICEHLRSHKQVKRVEPAGSLRRGRETIGDVDILCDSAAGKKVVEAFTSLPRVVRVLAAGATKGSVVVNTDEGNELQVDLRVVPSASFGAALQYFTGSKEHNVRLRELAIKKKYKLSEYGLFRGDKQIAGKTEKSIYTKLGLEYIPPELREDRGEIDAAGNLPRLVELADIRGDLHVHTTASDGRDTIEQMAAAARELGDEYLGICDHSASSTIANGLSPERMLKHIEAIRTVARKTKDIAILVGCECDILANGKLDYPDEILSQCEIVTASIHSGLGQSRSTVTKRTIAAMENPYVNIIGHPTGRLLGKREAMDLDIEAVIKAAVETNTALEVNAAWQRLDLKDTHVRQAVEAGAMIVINTDAHSTGELGSMRRYGVQTARRGWADKRSVLNTRPLAELRKFLRAKRPR